MKTIFILEYRLPKSLDTTIFENKVRETFKKWGVEITRLDKWYDTKSNQKVQITYDLETDYDFGVKPFYKFVHVEGIMGKIDTIVTYFHKNNEEKIKLLVSKYEL